MNPGDSLEIRVQDWLSRLLTERELPLNPDLTKITRHGKVFSRDRGSEITFDVVMELYRKSATIPCFYWLWECKDYTGLVPVDDIEEFHSKIEQVGRDKAKGTVVTTSGFQRSALTLAESYGIGLVRVASRSRNPSQNQQSSRFDDDDDAIQINEMRRTRPMTEREIRNAIGGIARAFGVALPFERNERTTFRTSQPTPAEVLLGTEPSTDGYACLRTDGRIEFVHEIGAVLMPIVLRQLEASQTGPQ